MKNPCRQIIEKILSGEIKTPEELNKEKRRLSSDLGRGRFVRNSEILEYAKPNERKRVLRILQKKPTRTISGVTVVATMTQPMSCPHGKCKYCPGGPEIHVPQSYTGKEPATRRAIRYSYNPYLQVTFRLKQLRDIGHPVSKAELIIMGGTLTAQCIDYQEWFVKEALRAMNEFEVNYRKIEKIGENDFIRNFEESEKKFHYLEEIQEKNEKSGVRCIGITFEPRPDWAKEDEINEMLRFGVTRVEIGVQNPSDKIYKKVDRGHTVKDVVEATQQLKDSGLKVGYHMMPGLLGNKPEIDVGAFKKIFNDQRFRPDMVKIYPCVVLRGTEYYDLWKRGKFEPMTTEQAINIILRIKQMMPKWIRTMRIMRDIPSPLIESGIKESNLGQLVYREMEKRDIHCKCIRCREVGHMLRKGIEPEMEYIEIQREDYKASNGREIFLSFEDTKNDILIGFLRLRIPYNPFRPEIDEKAILVRELHIYGPMVEIGERPLYEWQHRGYGKELLQDAERIAKEEFDMKKILVISGIGVRNYYRKLSYTRDGAYMGRKLE